MTNPLFPAAKLNKVHHADCLAGMKALPAGCVDLAFADPPFNIGYDYDVYDDRQGRSDYLEWSKNWLAGGRRNYLAPNMRMCSRTPDRRPTWRRFLPYFSRATRSSA